MQGDVLESALFPTVTFRITKIDGKLASTGSSTVTLRGVLSLHGKDHPLSMPATVDISGRHLKGQTSFNVPFIEWGLHDPSMFVLRVAKEVKVTVSLDGTLSEAVANAAH